MVGDAKKATPAKGRARCVHHQRIFYWFGFSPAYAPRANVDAKSYRLAFSMVVVLTARLGRGPADIGGASYRIAFSLAYGRANRGRRGPIGSAFSLA